MMAANQTSNAADQRENEAQYLTFLLDDQMYGVPILTVQEIRGWTMVTPLPNSPLYVKGVLNLRGTIIPVIDLRRRFNLPDAQYNELTVIMIINMRGRLAGAVVDAVSDVISAGADRHCETPDFEGQINRRFIQGLLEVDDRLVILLNTDELGDDLVSVAA